MPQLDIYMFYTSTIHTFIFFFIFIAIFKVLLLPMIFANLLIRRWFYSNLFRKRMIVTFNRLKLSDFKQNLFKVFLLNLLII